MLEGVKISEESQGLDQNNCQYFHLVCYLNIFTYERPFIIF